MLDLRPSSLLLLDRERTARSDLISSTVLEGSCLIRKSRFSENRTEAGAVASDLANLDWCSEIFANTTKSKARNEKFFIATKTFSYKYSECVGDNKEMLNKYLPTCFVSFLKIGNSVTELLLV
jgi:hypothetical protein